ncbi:MAG: HEAT repeat domain-containing protein, partial [Candidatus Udaeobacter sp.]
SQLIEQLAHPLPHQRAAAATALAEFDHLNADIVTALISASADHERDVRLAALNSLVRVWRSLTTGEGDILTTGDEIDQTFSPLNQAFTKRLRDDDKHIRLTAAEGLRELFSTDTAVFEVLVDAARDEDESLRRRAALALWLGISDRRATLFQIETEAGVGALTHLLNDNDAITRGYALRALATLGPLARGAVPTLCELLKRADSADDDLQFQAALALASVGEETDLALPLLERALTHGDRLKRKAAAFGLRSLGSKAQTALPTLIIGLKDHEKRVRSRCASAIGNIGLNVSDEAIQALMATQGDDDPEVLQAVERALSAIGAARVEKAQRQTARTKARDFFPLSGFQHEDIPGLIFMLKDPLSDVRAFAATALGRAGATEAVSELTLLLQDNDEGVRRRAAESLQKLGASFIQEE